MDKVCLSQFSVNFLGIKPNAFSCVSVKKAFVDPEDQEVGALDKFLIENATCLPKENFTLLQKIGNGTRSYITANSQHFPDIAGCHRHCGSVGYHRNL